MMWGRKYERIPASSPPPLPQEKKEKFFHWGHLFTPLIFLLGVNTQLSPLSFYLFLFSDNQCFNCLF